MMTTEDLRRLMRRDLNPAIVRRADRDQRVARWTLHLLRAWGWTLR